MVEVLGYDNTNQTLPALDPARQGKFMLAKLSQHREPGEAQRGQGGGKKEVLLDREEQIEGIRWVFAQFLASAEHPVVTLACLEL